MDLNDIYNLNFFSGSSISITRALLLFYVIIASSFTKELYSGQLKDFLMENRAAQHIIGFISILVLIGTIGGVTDKYRLMIYSVITYIWFVLTTKLDLKWNLAIIALLLLAFFYENNMIEKEKKIDSDASLDEQDKEKIKKRNNYVKLTILGSILVVTLLGSLSYLNKKQVQYGGNFDIEKFLFNARNKG